MGGFWKLLMCWLSKRIVRSVDCVLWDVYWSAVMVVLLDVLCSSSWLCAKRSWQQASAIRSSGMQLVILPSQIEDFSQQSWCSGCNCALFHPGFFQGISCCFGGHPHAQPGKTHPSGESGAEFRRHVHFSDCCVSRSPINCPLTSSYIHFPHLSVIPTVLLCALCSDAIWCHLMLSCPLSAHPWIVHKLASPRKCKSPRLIQELHGLQYQQLVIKKHPFNTNATYSQGVINKHRAMVIVYYKLLSWCYLASQYFLDILIAMCCGVKQREVHLVPILGLDVSSHGFQILFSEFPAPGGTHASIHKLRQAVDQGVRLWFALPHRDLQEFLLAVLQLSDVDVATHIIVINHPHKLQWVAKIIPK